MSIENRGAQHGQRDQHGLLFPLPPISAKQYARTKLSSVASFEAFVELDKMVQRKQENLPQHVRIPTTKYWATSKGANLLTAVIIFYLKQSGYHAERVNVQGTMRKIKGKMRYVPSTSTLGSADIHSVINGAFVAIEIKFGADVMSDNQIKYANTIMRSGGTYMIAKKLEDLIDYLEGE